MKTRRRYREKNHYNINDPIFRNTYIFDNNPHTEVSRIRDCWYRQDCGTLRGDGSVLWDSWRPKTKRQLKKIHNRLKNGFKEIVLPVIKKMMPSVGIYDIMTVQPMMRKDY